MLSVKRLIGNSFLKDLQRNKVAVTLGVKACVFSLVVC